MTTKPNAKQQTAHNRTLAALPLPSEEVLTPRRRVSAQCHDTELYAIRLSTFRRALSKSHISIDEVRELWLAWYGQYWDDIAGDPAPANAAAAAAVTS